MLRCRSRRITTLLAAAAAFAGTQGMIISVASAQGQPTPDSQPTVGDELTSPAAIIDRAQQLAENGKLVHAYEVLSDLLTTSGIELTDQERTQAMNLSVSINQKIQALNLADAVGDVA